MGVAGKSKFIVDFWLKGLHGLACNGEPEEVDLLGLCMPKYPKKDVTALLLFEATKLCGGGQKAGAR